MAAARWTVRIGSTLLGTSRACCVSACGRSLRTALHALDGQSLLTPAFSSGCLYAHKPAGGESSSANTIGTGGNQAGCVMRAEAPTNRTRLFPSKQVSANCQNAGTPGKSLTVPAMYANPERGDERDAGRMLPGEHYPLNRHCNPYSVRNTPPSPSMSTSGHSLRSRVL